MCWTGQNADCGGHGGLSARLRLSRPGESPTMRDLLHAKQASRTWRALRSRYWVPASRWCV